MNRARGGYSIGLGAYMGDARDGRDEAAESASPGPEVLSSWSPTAICGDGIRLMEEMSGSAMAARDTIGSGGITKSCSGERGKPDVEVGRSALRRGVRFSRPRKRGWKETNVESFVSPGWWRCWTRTASHPAAHFLT